MEVKLGSRKFLRLAVISLYSNPDTTIRRMGQAAHDFGHLVDMQIGLNEELKEIYVNEKIPPCDNPVNTACVSFSPEYSAWITQTYFSQQTNSITGVTQTAQNPHPQVRNLMETIYGQLPTENELDICRQTF